MVACFKAKCLKRVIVEAFPVVVLPETFSGIFLEVVLSSHVVGLEECLSD